MIRSRLKQTISTSGGSELLQIVSESASEDARLPRGVDYEISHRLKRGTKHFLYGCGKFFPNRRVLKP